LRYFKVHINPMNSICFQIRKQTFCHCFINFRFVAANKKEYFFVKDMNDLL